LTTKAAVDAFVSQRTLAVAGVSRSGKKFGNTIYRELKNKGYRVFAVHPQAAQVEGDPAYPGLAALPEAVGGVVVCIPPAQAEQVVHEAAAAGIRRVWLQQGAESEAAVRLGREKGLEVVAGECIMMFAAPVGFPHSMHRWVWKLLGKLPR
jgi:predicted CoA-binding protein